MNFLKNKINSWSSLVVHSRVKLKFSKRNQTASLVMQSSSWWVWWVSTYSLVSSRKWAAQRAQKKSLLETTNKTVDDFHEWSGLIHKQRHAKESDPSFGEADLPAHRSEIERGASKRPPHTTPLRCCCCWERRDVFSLFFSFFVVFFFFFWWFADR